MRRLPAILVTVLLAVLLLAAVTTAALSGGPSASDASAAPAQPPTPPEPGAGAPATPGDPAAPGGPAAPGAPGGPAAPGAPGAPAAPAGPLSVAFLGDGYTSGSASGGRGAANYTAILGSREGWKVTTDAVYGTGYVVDPAMETRLQKIVAAGPQVVVVSAGRADDQSQPQFVAAAATRLYESLKTKLPQSKVVVIGPMWLGDGVPPRVTAVGDAVRGAAEQAGLPYVDPLAAGWFVRGDQDGIAANRLDLNDKGQQRLAQLVDEALKNSGALPG